MLSHAIIVDKAVEVIDSDGLDALTMRSLGNALGVEAMSLYTYIGNRQQLLTDVLDKIVLEMSADPDMLWNEDDSWAEYLKRVAHGVRRIALVHPRVLPLMISQPPAAPWVRPPLRSLVWIEAFLGGLRAKGLSKDEVIRIYRSFTGFLLGHLLLEVSSQGVELTPAADVGEPAVKPDLRGYPNLLEMAPLLAAADPDRDFADALDDHVVSLGLRRP